ncbi:MAG: hypothetical protein R6W90_10435 [Ignavibacteriaceae bacterium]
MLKDININSLELLGYGVHGKAYSFGDKVLKITNREDEYYAALKLIQNPRYWSCLIYEAEKEAGKYFILEEKVELIDFKENHLTYPGNFMGIKYDTGEFSRIATRPVDLSLGYFFENNSEKCEIVRFTDNQVDLLAELYTNELQKRCYKWFVKAFWDVIEFGFDTSDLWNNIGINNDGSFVFFDLMIKHPGDQAG